MPATVDHYVFPQPKNPNCRIWRYMDFTKYLSLLNSESLYFTRADKFEDPYEGALGVANVALEEVVYAELKAKVGQDFLQMRHAMREVVRAGAKWTFISCWHANEFESAAMWKLYSRTEEAIAVQTTYARLCACLPEEAHCGLVQYVDYSNSWIPEGNSYAPFMHKRKSFEHEHEVRAIIAENVETGGDINVLRAGSASVGMSIPVEVSSLIETVYVAPTAPKWFATLVEEVSARYGFQGPFVQSSLYNAPVA